MVEALESNKLCGLLMISLTGNIQLTHSLVVNNAEDSIIGIQGNDLASVPVTAHLNQELFAS
jgi:hypothetical protein